jgi:DNA processing protein
MTPSISPNTQAILLLTAPLILGRNTASSDSLSSGEYKRLARRLREIQRQPADLLLSNASDVIRDCGTVVEEARLRRALSRGFLLSQAVERWRSRAIWVISRADAEYPQKIKSRLREDAPAVLYGCGDAQLLEVDGLAVVGSRHTTDSLVEYAEAIGQLCARAHTVLVSGGAKGIDQSAMHGALQAGGRVVGVLADSLERSTMAREHRNLLVDGHLVFVSPYDPSAGFNVGNAMKRNKVIYALSEASLVVDSGIHEGGTWAGAIEQLDKFHFAPVYVRSTGTKSVGLDALRAKGALPWPNPDDVTSFRSLLASATTSLRPDIDILPFPSENHSDAGREPVTTEEVADSSISDGGERNPERGLLEGPPRPYLQEAPPSQGNGLHQAVSGSVETKPADQLFATVRELLLDLLKTAKKDSEVATVLGVSKPQAKVWLQRMIEEGLVEESRKPRGFMTKQRRLID